MLNVFFLFFSSLFSPIHTKNGGSMVEKQKSDEFENLLDYCRLWYGIVSTDDNREQAIYYGRLSGFFTNEDTLTPMGEQVAKLINDGLAA